MTIEQAKSELMQIYGALSPDKQRAIDTLVKIEPKIGHWTHDGSHWKNRFICSKCGYKLFDEQTNFCPNCGAKMESEDKDADKKCTYKETGCGSCKRQLDCPIEANKTESEVQNESS